MDILILNWKDIQNPDVGGAEIILYELSKRLVKDGHRVTWFTRGFSGAVPEETIGGVTFVRRGGKLSVYIRAYLYYRNLARKPDRVIDCINTLCWQTPLYVPREKRIAYVNQLAKEVLFYELAPPLSHIAYLLEPLQYRTYRTTRFLCYSGSVKDDVGTFGIPKKNILTFPLGIDHGRYKEGVRSKTPLFLFVARLVNMKRPDVCIRAMKRVSQKHPDAKLAIVGYGPQQAELERLIKMLDLTRNVSIVNKDNLFFEKHHKDIKVKLMQAAWALVLPSVKEGWGMVVTEAAACATPAIVSNVTGLQDSVVHNQTGLVLSSFPSEVQMADAMITLIEDSKLRRRLSQGAKFWSSRYDWTASYSEFKKHVLKT
jgi:glycosyltransferase involved in cell wall biosynthesis